MARRETNHAANPGLRAGHEQSRLVYFASVGLRKKRRVVVVKNESTRVLGIFGAAGSRVAGTQITSGIVSGPIGRCRLIDLAEPWSLAAMRRDQHPFARQRVPAAMRILLQFRWSDHGSSLRAFATRSTPSAASHT
jgi:hypothetical protein